jgi:radical SAM-linked protein
VIYRERELCRHMLKRQKQGRLDEQTWQPAPIPKPVEPEPAQRIRFRIGRTGEAQFLSHLELVNAWVRALRRARAPLSYSQGFHAHPKITFATAPPVGEESIGDYMDVVLKERVEPRELLARLKATLPQGFGAFAVEEVPLRAPALMAACAGFGYLLFAVGDAESVALGIEEILGAREVLVDRKVKVKDGRGRERLERAPVDIRPMIRRLELVRASASDQSDGSGSSQLETRTRGVRATHVVIEFDTEIVGGRFARPREILTLLGLVPAGARVLKRETFLSDQPQRAREVAFV